MEYLMTYGWAILIIAVVLAALFQLGVFNPATFAPKASPGSCQTLRPNGPYSTDFMRLVGSCNNELPHYVIQFTSQNSLVQIPYQSGTPLFSLSNAFTFSAWINPNSASAAHNIIARQQCNNAWPDTELYLGESSPSSLYVQLVLNYANSGTYTSFIGGVLQANKWYMISATFNKATNTVMIYVNGHGVHVANYSQSVWQATTPFMIGGISAPSPGCWSSFGMDQLANVQVYNSALSSNDIISLYNEGLGGVPVQLHSLVGWWPLNGDSKDYSGNEYNSVTTNALYTGSWASSYFGPS